MESVGLTVKEVAEIGARYGDYTDFGKTFFTDDELFDFVLAVMVENDKKVNRIFKQE